MCSSDLDYVAAPSIGGNNAVRTVALTTVASATDMSTPVDCSGRYVSIYNAGPGTAFVVFDSVSTGTAASASNAMPIPAGGQRDVLLAAYNPNGSPTRPNKFLKAVSDSTATLSFYVSTNYAEGV